MKKRYRYQIEVEYNNIDGETEISYKAICDEGRTYPTYTKASEVLSERVDIFKDDVYFGVGKHEKQIESFKSHSSGLVYRIKTIVIGD